MKAVKDVLEQYRVSDAAVGDDLDDAMNNLQAVYDRVTGQKDYLELPAKAGI